MILQIGFHKNSVTVHRLGNSKLRLKFSENLKLILIKMQIFFYNFHIFYLELLLTTVRTLLLNPYLHRHKKQPIYI